MTNYYITCVKIIDVPKKHISHVMLNEQIGGVPSKGFKRSKDEVVNLINSGRSVSTAMWDYNNKKWKPGAQVEILHENELKYLRSGPDNSVLDNLLHLLPLDSFM